MVDAEAACSCEERFTFGQTLHKCFALLVDRLDVYTGLYALNIPLTGLLVALALALDAVDSDVWQIVLVVAMIVLEFVLLAIAVLTAAAIVYTAACVSNAGHNPGFRKALKVAARRLGALLGATLLMALPEYALMLLAFSMRWDTSQPWMCVVSVVVWTICGALLLWMMCGTACLIPTIMLGHLGPIKAISKSFRLARGNHFYIVCLLFTVGALEQGIMAFVFQLLNASGPMSVYLIYLQAVTFVGPGLVFPAFSAMCVSTEFLLWLLLVSLHDWFTFCHVPFALCSMVTVVYIGLRRAKDGLSELELQRELMKYDTNETPVDGDNDMREPLLHLSNV